MTKKTKISLTKSQVEFVMSLEKFPLFCAGYGCIRGSTKVYTVNGLVPIESITSPTLVLSYDRTNNRFQLSLSGGAFPKGRDYLYRVSTTRGEFVVSAHHRVFCGDGVYRLVKDLKIGDEMHQAPQALQHSIEEHGLIGLPLGEGHLNQRRADCLGDYADKARQYGQQLLSEEVAYQASARPQGDAQVYCRFYDYLDARNQKQERIHLLRSFGHTCKSRSDLQLDLPEGGAEDLASALRFEHTLQSTRRCGQLREKFFDRHTETLLSSNCRDVAYSTPDVSYIIDINIEKSQEVFYDMQVLDTNNYICEDGFIHHNSGKSHVMGFCAVSDAMHSSSALIGVYEPDYSLIRTIAIPRVRQWLDEFGFSYTLNKQDQAIYTSSTGVGDFQFKSLDNPDSLVGYETYRSHIDELDTLPADKAEAVFFKIMGRNRQSPNDVAQQHRKWVEASQRYECINRIYAYTTPEGFKFCHKMWSPDGENATKNPDFRIFKGRTEDNPTLTEDYIQSLKSIYPAALLKAYMEGEFVNLESGTVYYTFNRERHNTTEQARPNDTLHIGVDFNVNKTCGIVFVDRGDKTCIVDEIVNQYDTKALIDEIKRRYPNNRIICYPDASGKRRTSSNTAKSDIIQLREAGFEVRARESNPAVKDRVVSAVKKFSDDSLLVNVAVCKEVVKCLEQQAYDVNGDPDKKSGFDHTNDALGYTVFYRFGLRKPVFRIPFSFAQKR